MAQKDLIGTEMEMAPETLKFLLWLWRVIGRNKIGQNFKRRVRGRMVWSFASVLHLQLAHQLRDFSLRALNAGVHNMKPRDFMDLANGFRNVFAQLLEIDEACLHCTIKLIADNPEKPGDKASCKIVTVARSSPLNRPPEYVPCYYLPSENSAFAALLGCDDRKNKWHPHVYSCFLCNDLPKEDRFDCKRENWQTFYKCAAVFPLRYMRHETGTFEHIGFLTVDSLDVGALGDVPSTFDYLGTKRDAYEKIIRYSPLVQTGGLAADVLATVLLQLMQHSEQNEKARTK